MKNVNELLIEATNDGNEVIVKECIKLGADPLYFSPKSEYGFSSSFDLSIKEGKFELFKILFDALIEQFKTNEDGKFKNLKYSQILYSSVLYERIEMIKYILEKTKVVLNDCIIPNIINDNEKHSIEILKIFIEYGFELKNRIDVNSDICFGKIDLKLITFLVENGLSIEKLNTDKINAVLYYCDIEVFKYITNKINLKKSLTYLLSSAVAFEKNDIAKYLISIGAKPENKKIKECIKSMK